MGYEQEFLGNCWSSSVRRTFMKKIAPHFLVMLCIASGVAAGEYNYYYGDIHSHTGYSDGWAVSVPADAYAHARDIAHLDFYSVTDHKYPSAECGPQDWPLTEEEYEWTKEQANAANQDGAFVALYGYEWTIAGGAPHGNVYMAADFITSCIMETFYQNLFDRRLADRRVFGHFNHPAIDGGWGDLAFSSMGGWAMRLMEVRGEFPPALNKNELTGEIAKYVEALEKGWLVGVDGSKDTHATTWGEFGSASWQKFNTVALATSLTRDSIIDALQMRRTYVSADTDFLANPLDLMFSATGSMGNSYIMGEAINMSNCSPLTLTLNAQDGGSDYLNELRIYKNGNTVARASDLHATTHTLTYLDEDAAPGDFYFGYVLEEDGDNALTSAILVRAEDTDSDGLTDEEEINQIGTNPNYADTDGDGFNDGLEWESGTDPLDPLSFPPSATPTPSPAPPSAWTPTATPTPALMVIYPDGGETLRRKRITTFHWGTGGDVGDAVRLGLLRRGAVYVFIEVPNTGSFTCVIPKGIPRGNNYQVGVQSIITPSVWDVSDRYFRIR